MNRPCTASGMAMCSRSLRTRRRSAATRSSAWAASHEAAAVDPATGYVYLTEDLRNLSGFYRFVPNDTSGPTRIARGRRRLQAAKVAGRNNASLIVAKRCDEYTLEWIDIVNPDQDASPAGGPQLPGFDVNPRGSGPFVQAGRRRIATARSEGIGIQRARCMWSTPRPEWMGPTGRAAARVRSSTSPR